MAIQEQQNPYFVRCEQSHAAFFCTHLRSQYKQNEEPRLYFGYLQLPGYDGPILGNTDAGMIGIIEVSELEKHATCKLVVQYNIGDCVVLLWDQNSATWTLWEKNGTHFSALGLRTLVQTQHYLLEEDVFDENMFDAVNDLPSNNEPRVDLFVVEWKQTKPSNEVILLADPSCSRPDPESLDITATIWNITKEEPINIGKDYPDMAVPGVFMAYFRVEFVSIEEWPKIKVRLYFYNMAAKKMFSPVRVANNTLRPGLAINVWVNDRVMSTRCLEAFSHGSNEKVSGVLPNKVKVVTIQNEYKLWPACTHSPDSDTEVQILMNNSKQQNWLQAESIMRNATHVVLKHNSRHWELPLLQNGTPVFNMPSWNKFPLLQTNGKNSFCFEVYDQQKRLLLGRFAYHFNYQNSDVQINNKIYTGNATDSPMSTEFSLMFREIPTDNYQNSDVQINNKIYTGNAPDLPMSPLFPAEVLPYVPLNFRPGTLHSAALTSNSAPVMKKLLSKGTMRPDEPNSFGATPMHLAAFVKNFGALELLLQAASDNPDRHDIRDKRGRSIMDIAKQCGNTKIRELVERDFELAAAKAKEMKQSEKDTIPAKRSDTPKKGSSSSDPDPLLSMDTFSINDVQEIDCKGKNIPNLALEDRKNVAGRPAPPIPIHSPKENQKSPILRKQLKSSVAEQRTLLNFRRQGIQFSVRSNGETLLLQGTTLFNKFVLEVSEGDQLEKITKGRLRKLEHLVMFITEAVDGKSGCAIFTEVQEQKITLTIEETDRYDIVRTWSFELEVLEQSEGTSVKQAIQKVVCNLDKLLITGYEGEWKFDPSVKHGNLTLFNNDTAVVHSGGAGHHGVHTKGVYTTGVHHIVFRIIRTNESRGVITLGVSPSTGYDLGTYAGHGNNSAGASMNGNNGHIYFNNTNKASNLPFRTGDYVGVELNMNAKTVKFYVNGVPSVDQPITGDAFSFVANPHDQCEAVEILPHFCWSKPN